MLSSDVLFREAHLSSIKYVFDVPFKITRGLMFVKKNAVRPKVNTREWIVLGICLACTFLFITAAYSKIADHETFLKGLSKVEVIANNASLISWLVPVAEIIIGLMLIIPRTTVWGLFGFTALMGIFTFYIFGMWLWADRLPCHCNLVIEKLSWGQHIWFNLGFMFIALIAIKLSRGNLKI